MTRKTYSTFYMEAVNKDRNLRGPALPPGPGGLPFLGSLVNYFRDPLGFLSRVAAEYGDIAYFKVGSRRIYLLSHPDLIKDVLVTHNRSFTKSRALNRAKLVLGEGLLTSEGKVHLKQRRIIQPIFHHRRIKTYGDVMAEHASRICRNWQNGQVIDLHKEMMRLTLGVVSKTLFDADVESEADEIGKALTDLVGLFPRFVFPFSEILDYLPLPGNKRGQEAISRLDDIIYGLIEERKRNPGVRYDLLSMLLEAQDDEGDRGGMSDKQVRDEAVTLFLAGQETTANALSWTWYLLSQNPKADGKMYEEVDSALSGRSPSVEDLGQLPYTHKVFKEALRLYPPAWLLARHAIEDYEADGYIVPSGADIFMSQYAVHRDPRIYTDPLTFNPDRWDKEDESKLPKYAYFPFGGGPRRCIGEPFAWMEGVISLAAMASGWKMHLVPHQRIEPEPLITIRPKYGLKMIVEKR